jgi:single-strand DNA-binding protein
MAWVVVWAKLAEICGQLLKKGCRVYIEGKLHTRQFTDSDNIQRSITEIVANEVQLLDKIE